MSKDTPRDNKSIFGSIGEIVISMLEKTKTKIQANPKTETKTRLTKAETETENTSSLCFLETPRPKIPFLPCACPGSVLSCDGLILSLSYVFFSQQLSNPTEGGWKECVVALGLLAWWSPHHPSQLTTQNLDVTSLCCGHIYHPVCRIINQFCVFFSIFERTKRSWTCHLSSK